MKQKFFWPDDDEKDDEEKMAVWQDSPEYDEFLESMQDDLAQEKSQDQDADLIDWP